MATTDFAWPCQNGDLIAPSLFQPANCGRFAHGFQAARSADFINLSQKQMSEHHMESETGFGQMPRASVQQFSESEIGILNDFGSTRYANSRGMLSNPVQSFSDGHETAPSSNPVVYRQAPPQAPSYPLENVSHASWYTPLRTTFQAAFHSIPGLAVPATSTDMTQNASHFSNQDQELLLERPCTANYPIQTHEWHVGNFASGLTPPTFNSRVEHYPSVSSTSTSFNSNWHGMESNERTSLSQSDWVKLEATDRLNSFASDLSPTSLSSSSQDSDCDFREWSYAPTMQSPNSTVYASMDDDEVVPSNSAETGHYHQEHDHFRFINIPKLEQFDTQVQSTLAAISETKSIREIRPRPVFINSNMSTLAGASSARRAFSRSRMDQERDMKDHFLVRLRREGLSYREIRKKGNFCEAESTLRGRYRTLTKEKEHRVRKPTWNPRDVRLLREGVLVSTAPSRKAKLTRGVSTQPRRISWKQVADYIVQNGGSYHFGNATCKKKWEEISEDDQVVESP